MKIKSTLIASLFTATCLFTSSKSNAQNSIEADPLIQELLVLKAKMTENNELNERYKIQLFYGSNLNEANKVKDKYERLFSEWKSDIVFETPNYKVWVGNFRNKLEAERAFTRLHNEFKSAIIFKP